MLIDDQHIPYKDVKGTWAVQIILTPAFVTVVHRKKEQAVSAAPEEFFEFEYVPCTLDLHTQIRTHSPLIHALCDYFADSLALAQMGTFTYV